MGNGLIRIKRATNYTPRPLVNIEVFDLRTKGAIQSEGGNDE